MDFNSTKNAFFDSSAVIAMMDKKERQALSKAGAFIRRRSKSSLRYRKKASSAGSPPSVHRGAFTKTTTNRKTGIEKKQAASPLKELIFFAFDATKKTTVIGPVIFRKSNLVPRLLEGGGSTTIRKIQPAASERKKAKSPAQSAAFRRKVANGTIVIPKRKVDRVGIVIAPRPFMNPAMMAELPKFVDLFRG